MTDRRSGRARKTVDYSKFAAGDSDNDDDFKETSTQPTKRKKSESTSPKSLKVKLTKVDVNSCKKEIKKLDIQVKENEDDAQNRRPSLSDKVFQRHISEALEISKQNSQPPPSENGNGSSLLLSGQEEEEEEEESSEGDKIKSDLSVPADINILTNGNPSYKEKTKGKMSKTDDDAEWNDPSSSESNEEDDASDWSGDDKEIEVKKPAVKINKSFKRNQDEDDEADWSDGDGKKKSKKPTVKKGKPKKSVSTKVLQSPTSVSLKCSKPSRKTRASSIVSPGLKPSDKAPGTPCQVISSPVKLPPKGLRLGLSRKVPSKPLHPVIKAQH